jgi:hypothetical protein
VTVIDPAPPDIDENGVDRAQIRAMLALTPEERLAKVEEFVDSVREIQDLAALPVLRATLDELNRRS